MLSLFTYTCRYVNYIGYLGMVGDILEKSYIIKVFSITYILRNWEALQKFLLAKLSS